MNSIDFDTSDIVDKLAIAARKIRVEVEKLDPLQRIQRAEGTSQFDNKYQIDVIADNIVHEIFHDFSGYILSEERAVDTTQMEKNPLILVVDPIDGSSNASRNLNYWCFSAALALNGKIIVGMVVDQVRQRTYLATNSTKPSLTHADGTIELLEEAEVRDVGTSADNFAPAIINFNSHDGPSIPFRHLRNFGASALAICEVASGGLDAYIDDEDILLKPWDLLAAEYIAQRAGCKVIRRDSEALFAATGVLIARQDALIESLTPIFPHFFH